MAAWPLISLAVYLSVCADYMYQVTVNDYCLITQCGNFLVRIILTMELLRMFVLGHCLISSRDDALSNSAGETDTDAATPL